MSDEDKKEDLASAYLTGYMAGGLPAIMTASTTSEMLAGIMGADAAEADRKRFQNPPQTSIVGGGTSSQSGPASKALGGLVGTLLFAALISIPFLGSGMGANNYKREQGGEKNEDSASENSDPRVTASTQFAKTNKKLDSVMWTDGKLMRGNIDVPEGTRVQILKLFDNGTVLVRILSLPQGYGKHSSLLKLGDLDALDHRRPLSMAKPKTEKKAVDITQRQNFPTHRAALKRELPNFSMWGEVAPGGPKYFARGNLKRGTEVEVIGPVSKEGTIQIKISKTSTYGVDLYGVVPVKDLKPVHPNRSAADELTRFVSLPCGQKMQISAPDARGYRDVRLARRPGVAPGLG